MIIIIEGCDGVGKTTYVEKLLDSEQFIPNVAVFHADRFTTLETYYELIEKHKGTDTTLIMDRSWISELVYGPIMRGISVYDTAIFLSLMEAIKGHAVLYYLKAEWPVVLERFLSRGDAYIPVNKLHDLYSKYDEVMEYVRRLNVAPVLEVRTDIDASS